MWTPPETLNGKRRLYISRHFPLTTPAETRPLNQRQAPHVYKPRPGDTGPVSDLVSTLEAAAAAACDFARQPRAEYAVQQAQQRDDSIAAAKGGALTVSASIVAWVSGTVGALFFAVGWIRRGFRKKTEG